MLNSALWSTLSAVGSRGAPIAASVIAARVLSRDAFGAFGVVQNTILTIGVFCTASITLTAARFVSKYHGRNDTLTRQVIQMSQLITVIGAAIGVIVVLAFASSISEGMFNSPALTVPLRWSAIGLACATINSGQIGILIGLQKFKRIAIATVSAVLATVPLCLAGIYWPSISTFVIALALGQLLAVLVFQEIIKKECNGLGRAQELRRGLSLLPGMLMYSGKATLTALLVAPVNWLAFSILAREQNGLGEIALINAIMPWRFLILLGAGNVAQATLPILSSQSDLAHQNAVVYRMLRLCLVITLPVFIITCLSASAILSMYGEGYRLGWLAFLLFQASALLQVIDAPFIKYLETSDRLWLNFGLNGIWALLVLAGTYFMAPLGAFGFALVQLAAFLVFTLPLLIVVPRLLMGTMGASAK